MSDEQTGQLLFYSNGKHVFNANHDTMINGYEAGLSNSITQNIAVKKPGSSHLYYLFTADVEAPNFSMNPNGKLVSFCPGSTNSSLSIPILPPPEPVLNN